MFRYYLNTGLFLSGLGCSVLLFCASEMQREATNIHTYGSIFPVAERQAEEKGRMCSLVRYKRARKSVKRRTGATGGRHNKTTREAMLRGNAASTWLGACFTCVIKHNLRFLGRITKHQNSIVKDKLCT